MAMAALSPNSVLATPIDINPQVKNDLQASPSQVAQDAQKAVKTAQTDTVTISSQALKMADDKNVVAKETADKADERRALQLARGKADSAKNESQRNAVRAYTAVSANQ